MSYEIHIERENGEEIGIDEWEEAIGTTEGIRLATSDATVENPQTGQTIRIPRNRGDSEAHSSELGDWLPLVQFARGRGSFSATDEFLDDTSTCRGTMRALACKLRAQLVGDEGEVHT